MPSRSPESKINSKRNPYKIRASCLYCIKIQLSRELYIHYFHLECQEFVGKPWSSPISFLVGASSQHRLRFSTSTFEVTVGNLFLSPMLYDMWDRTDPRKCANPWAIRLATHFRLVTAKLPRISCARVCRIKFLYSIVLKALFFHFFLRSWFHHCRSAPWKMRQVWSWQ